MQLCKRKIIELVLKYTATHAVLHIGDNGDLFLRKCDEGAVLVCEAYTPSQLVTVQM
jgi:hypothetical protein